jgi:hypothetical protein
VVKGGCRPFAGPTCTTPQNDALALGVWRYA